MTFQHSAFRRSRHERTPGICAAVVDIELEALATVEDAGKFALNLTGDLEERWQAESVCVYIEGVREVMLVDGVAQLCGQVEQGAGVLAGHGGLECCQLSTGFAARIDFLQVMLSDVQGTADLLSYIGGLISQCIRTSILRTICNQSITQGVAQHPQAFRQAPVALPSQRDCRRLLASSLSVSRPYQSAIYSEHSSPILSNSSYKKEHINHDRARSPQSTIP